MERWAAATGSSKIYIFKAALNYSGSNRAVGYAWCFIKILNVVIVVHHIRHLPVIPESRAKKGHINNQYPWTAHLSRYIHVGPCASMYSKSY
jgi:hypothetical protein